MCLGNLKRKDGVMPAYVVGAIYDIKDPAGFYDYRSVAGPTVANFGGKFIAGGESVEAVEGDWAPLGFVVLEFESMERAKRWYRGKAFGRYYQSGITGIAPAFECWQFTSRNESRL